MELNLEIRLGMLNALFGITAESDFVKYIVHCARSNDGNDQSGVYDEFKETIQTFS